MANIVRSRLIAEVAASLQIRLDEDDPAIVVVEITRLILEQAIRSCFKSMRERKPGAAAPPSPDLRRLAEEIAIRSPSA